jgi:hypothetical protein
MSQPGAMRHRPVGPHGSGDSNSPLALKALVPASVASMAAALIASALGDSPVGTLATAAITPLITAFIITLGPRHWQRILTAAGLALVISVAGLALVISVAVISLFELRLGRALTDPNKRSTFEIVATTIAPFRAIDIRPNHLECGEVQVGASKACPMALTITNTGTTRLYITRLDVGPARGDFTPGTECLGRLLDPSQTCAMVVQFHPSGVKIRSAALVIHHDIPPPDTGTKVLPRDTDTTILLIGTGTPALPD